MNSTRCARVRDDFAGNLFVVFMITVQNIVHSVNYARKRIYSQLDFTLPTPNTEQMITLAAQVSKV